MKLRKILAGFLAGAIAMGSMVVTSVTASAEDMVLTNTPVTVQEGTWANFYNFEIGNDKAVTVEDLETYENLSITFTYTDETVTANTGGNEWRYVQTCKVYPQAYTGNYAAPNSVNGDGIMTGPSGTITADTEYVVNITINDILADLEAKLSNGDEAIDNINQICIQCMNCTATLTKVALTGSKDTTVYAEQDITSTFNSEGAIMEFDGEFDTTAINGAAARIEVTFTPNADNSGVKLIKKTESGYDYVNALAMKGGDGTLNQQTAVFKFNTFTPESIMAINTWGVGSISKVVIYNDSTKGDVFAESAPPTYSITTSAVTNGSVAVSLSPDESATEIIEEAAAEESVNIFFKPNAGYEVASYKVVGDSGDVVLTSDEDEDPSEVTAVSFTMPEEAVTITVTYAVAEYDVTVEKATNGTITASSATAKYNDEITITATPAEGYELASVVVKNKTTNDNITVTDNKFKMPADDVTISATFTAKDAEKFALTLAETTNGTVKLSAETAAAGTKITVTATPATGYEVYDIIVKGTSGKTYDVSAFTFEMPAEAVTVTVTFEEQEIEEEEKGFEETKTLVDEAAKNGTVLKQTATFDGVEAVRYTKVVSLDEIKKASKATFSFKTNDGKTGSYTTTKFYSALGVSGSSVNAPEGYGFLSLTVINIPDGVELTCTSITLS